MVNLRLLPQWMRSLACNRGGVLIYFAGVMFGLILMVGAAVDYTRATQFKSALQNLADAAALAGASAYVSPATAATGVTTATNYFNAGLAYLPPNIGVGTPTITSSSDANGYYIRVFVPTSRIRTTFLALVMNSIPVQVNAMASDPIVTGNVDFGGWTTSAYDGNTIYWYAASADGSIPSFDTDHANQAGFNTAFHAIFTNICAKPAGHDYVLFDRCRPADRLCLREHHRRPVSQRGLLTDDELWIEWLRRGVRQRPCVLFAVESAEQQHLRLSAWPAGKRTFLQRQSVDRACGFTQPLSDRSHPRRGCLPAGNRQSDGFAQLRPARIRQLSIFLERYGVCGRRFRLQRRCLQSLMQHVGPSQHRRDLDQSGKPAAQLYPAPASIT